VAIYHSLKSGGTLGYDFFHDEYKVDYAIATMRTPTVALLRGITSTFGCIHARGCFSPSHRC